MCELGAKERRSKVVQRAVKGEVWNAGSESELKAGGVPAIETGSTGSDDTGSEAEWNKERPPAGRQKFAKLSKLD
ncbi:uncharacterized protein N7496_012414 [Penicillium cataractarum]|uniref:Uncharacterized protein n=1 Tax=Penicillium cataractarum TaxID=2100454 RepID=A0A9W9R7K0_9EURO|nr:uncharacterized protein N7496_012414 [Penicillium cataractarum]KAJ5355202.1 hypothetical protein N7496_012414 [Penicillium cataractarum]